MTQKRQAEHVWDTNGVCQIHGGYCSMAPTTPDDGWHYGPDGTPQRGFREGTAFQPDDTRDHMDAWGSVHPENLKDCVLCHSSAVLTRASDPCPNCTDGTCTECGGDGCDECSHGGTCPECDGTGRQTA